MSKTYDVCIRGAGIVGSTLALHLAANRLRVALVTQANTATGHSDVRAYALNQTSRTLLESVRCWPDEVSATAVTSMQIWGDDGGMVRFDASEQQVDALNWIVDVPVLEAQLAQAVKFQPQIDVVESAQNAPLTVVCEGRASLTRQEFGVDFDTIPYDQWALAARVRCEMPHGKVARQWFVDGEIVALLPLDGPAGNLCALVWSVSPNKAPELQTLSESEFTEQLQTATRNTLGALTLVSERKIWALQAAQARRWSGQNAQGAWVLTGDAAHNVHPLAGQGLNLGLGDVAELSRVLDARPYWRNVDDTKLLRAYERARKADYAVVGGSGDSLQKLFTLSVPAAQSLRNLGMHAFERSGPFKQWIARRAMGSKHSRR